MKKLKPITISKARTAWTLLKDVRKHMAEEPKRVDMRSVFYLKYPEQGGPPCGTVGCFAGNIAIKAGIRTNIFNVQLLLGPLQYHCVGSHNFDVFNAGTGDACGTTCPGTAWHLNAVLDRVDHFMRINEKRLKARTIPTTAKGRQASVDREKVEA